MKKSLIITILLVAVSTVIYAGGGGKKSSFGKWNYDKFGEGTVKITNAEASQISNSQDPCRQYVHVSSKFHVRVKNWFQGLQLGLSGYAEMRATLGNATQSCGIPYNIARMDIYYDYTKHVTSVNQSYLKATMKGIGAVNECYKAIGYAFTGGGIVLPNGYRGNIVVNGQTNKIPGDINIQQVFGLNVEALGIPFVTNTIPLAWFVPIQFTTGSYTIATNPYAGAIFNEEKGCINLKLGKIKISF